MREIVDFFNEVYLSKIKNNPELFIGVELEYPIVNSSGGPTSIQVAKDLFKYLSNIDGFNIVRLDRENNPIELLHVTGDIILFEVTYNTIEFAFTKSKSIFEVDDRFQEYLYLVQKFLKAFNHELQGIGINPNWKVNDHRAVEIGRYKMLMNYLKLSENFPDMHEYHNYAGFICGNQVQFDVSQENFLRVINAFNKIEPVKAFLFANSEFEYLDEMAISRDYFWEKSMHGLIKENIGVYPYEFSSKNEFISFLLETAIFYIERNNDYFYFFPIPIKDYLRTKEIVAYSENGEKFKFTPKLEDLSSHRSYHYQELTKRGTIEFRSVCAQSFDNTFTPIAFHLGLLVNLFEFEKILEKSSFYQLFGSDYRKLRHQFSKQNLSEIEVENIKMLAIELYYCSLKGLELRDLGEEKYLESIKMRLLSK